MTRPVNKLQIKKQGLCYDQESACGLEDFGGMHDLSIGSLPVAMSLQHNGNIQALRCTSKSALIGEITCSLIDFEYFLYADPLI